MDAFYASIEQIDNPEFRGKPVIVGAQPGRRGVVSACSYEAREYGIHSAMPISQAYALCREGIFVPVRMKRYQELSRSIMHIFDDFTPLKFQISIDEAFLDMSGTEKLFGPPAETAKQLKTRVKEETGLTVSVGIAPNRLLAKIASDQDKPDGLVEVKPGSELQFLDTVSLKDIWGLGKKTLEVLWNYNITTVQQLREADISMLRRIAGKSGGLFLYNASRGIDPGIYSGEPKTKSVSSEVTFNTDVAERDVLAHTLFDLSDQIMFRLQEQNDAGKTVFIKIRYADFQTISARTTHNRCFQTADEIYKTALRLFDKKWNRGSPLRLLGLGVSGVEEKTGQSQIPLFSDTEDQKSIVEETVYQLRAHGSRITKASLLNRKSRR